MSKWDVENMISNCPTLSENYLAERNVFKRREIYENLENAPLSKNYLDMRHVLSSNNIRYIKGQ